jgi:hypothetical protein
VKPASLPDDRFDFQIFFEDENPELAPITGLLVSAKRKAAVECSAVEVNTPCADAIGDGTRLPIIVAPIRRNEARVDSTINTASAARSTRLNPSYWQYLCRRLTQRGPLPKRNQWMLRLAQP